jgi:hypothetical protein
VTIRIEAHHFVAGIDVDPRTHLVVHAAPILGYMLGWTALRVREYCDARGWTARRVPDPPAG